MHNAPFSRIISGTMTWGRWGKDLNSSQMTALIVKTVALGIHTFDHADIYGGYTTEAAFGKAFTESGIVRESVQFISKCGIQYPCENRPLPIKYYDYSEAHIRKSVEQSLRNLQTDYLDILLFHRPSPLMHAEEMAAIATTLKEEGKIRSIGVSNFTPSQMALLHSYIPITWNQIACSLSHHEPLFDGTLDMLQKERIGAMIWNPLGNYYKAPGEAEKRMSKVVNRLCEEYDAADDQILLAWLMKHPACMHPVVGTTEPKRLERAVKAVEIDLKITDWFQLLEAATGKRVP